MDTGKVVSYGTILLDRYEVIKQIGCGGMSKVFLVRDLRLNTSWALKEVMIPKGDMMRQSILAEAYMLIKLRHPSLPRIVDICEDDLSVSIVMDYIDGQSLGKVIEEEGPQPVKNVINWSIQLCGALHYLHTQTPPIIYRDMKPWNVMLKPDGTVVLIDFGIAREYSAVDIGDTVWLGTTGYAAPEQYGGGGQTDPRTDIYGLGATMYKLITGYSPADTQHDVLQISNFRPELKGSSLEKIIAKCCALERENRYQNCEELLYALEHYDDSFSLSMATGNRINSIMRSLGGSILNLKRKTENNETQLSQKNKYQVFISFKHTDDYGNETPDSRLAEGLYKKLRAKGIKTFFSKKSIVDEASDKYKNTISHALKESRILVVVGTRPDYMNGAWVKREYCEFRSKMKHAGSADEYAIFNYLGPEMHVNSLPEELKDYTSYTDVIELKEVILNRLLGLGKQEEMPIELRAEAVWEHYHSGVVINKRYQLFKCVKEGWYYKLFEASDLNVNDNLRLVKIVNNYLIGDHSDPEIECLKLLSDVSRGIPTIFDFGSEEEITYLVTNYAHGTRLDELMKSSIINEEQIIIWMLDICDTLYSLHSHNPGVIHCNIKPSNIFIEKERAELINFSAAYIEGRSPKDNGLVSGRRYRAPELTVLLKSNQNPTPSTDIYSLGYTMLEVLLADEKITSFKNNKKKTSLGLRYILKKCTSSDPSERYQSVLELKNDLENTRLAGLKAIKLNLQQGVKRFQVKHKAQPEMSTQRWNTAPLPPSGKYYDEYIENQSIFHNQVDSDYQTTLLRPFTHELNSQTPEAFRPFEHDSDIHTEVLKSSDYDFENE